MDHLSEPTGDARLDKHIEYIRKVEWEKTPLGDIQTWPKEIAVLLAAVMYDPYPRLLLLGLDLQMLYNPAYGEMVGECHPNLLGMNVYKGWPKQEKLIAEILDSVRKTDRPHLQDDVPFNYKRNGLLEEIYLNWSTLPLRGPLPGFYVAFTDVTESKVADHRRDLLRTMSQAWNLASDMSSLWTNLMQGITLQPREFPLALLYTADSEPAYGDPHSHGRDGSHFILEKFIGEASARPFIQDSLDLDNSKELLESAVYQAVGSSSKDPQLLWVADGVVPEAWIHAAKGRGYSDGLPDDLIAVVILPIKSIRVSKTVGVLILGLNTRRPWNLAYQSWISEFGREINECVTSILSKEEAVRLQHENVKRAAREHILLAKESAAGEREAVLAKNKAMRLLKMMEQVDVGIFEYSPAGKLLQANDAWYRQSGHSRQAEMHTEFSFMDCVYPADRTLVANLWNRISKGETLTFEMRWSLKSVATRQEPSSDGQWVLTTSYPLMDESGKLIAIFGCTTDIGPQKTVVADALRRAEVLERARASEKEASRANEKYQRMTQLIDEISVGVFEYDIDGHLVQANDAFYKLSGIDRERDNTAVSFGDALFSEDYQHVMDNWKAVIQGTPANFEMRWKAPHKFDGYDRWVLAACVPGRDDDGNVTTVFGCLTDIDAQKRAETESKRRAEALERARTSEHRLVHFMETAAMPIFLLDYPSKKMTYCNEAWFNMTAMPETSKGLGWNDVVLEEDVWITDKIWRDIIEKQGTLSVQFRLKSMWTGASGEALSPKWVVATMSPEFNQDGSLKAVTGTMSDITGFKFAESVNQALVDGANESKRQQENFIDMTSHEIRNPLGAVVHCADSLTDSLTEMRSLVQALPSFEHAQGVGHFFELIESSLDAVVTISSCTAHQQRIVDDILVLSKLDSNLLQIAPSNVSVVEVLQNVQKMFEVEAQRVSVGVKTEIDPSLQDMNVEFASMDSGRCLQILINLVTNAIKFTKNEEIREVTIRMGASKERPSENELQVDFALSQSLRDSIFDAPGPTGDAFYIWFTVCDTGRGMTPEEKSKIFARFAQGSPRTYSEYGGSGLGLFISRELAGLQGGEIGVASEAGKGSTFAFFIKTHRVAAGLPATTDGHSRKDMLIAPHEVCVLVVEDNLLNQRVLRKQLSKHGYKVSTADNGQEALNFLKKSKHWTGKDQKHSHSKIDCTIKVDVILMDVEMPIMNGLESARRIREYEEEGSLPGHVPIIAVSANARAEQTNRALAVGMDDAICKPFRIVDLIPKIDRCASWRKADLT